jgi:hypothetical protein
MRVLTFEGFLKGYVRELSLQQTLSMRKLACEAIHDNPRLREPLLLYALFSEQTDRLMVAVAGTALENTYKKILGQYSKTEMLADLKKSDSPLSNNYLKVYRSYVSLRDKKQAEDHTKQLMWGRINRLKEEKHISNYRIYTTLGLNPGNANAYLKHGDPKKIGLSAARKTLHYLESAQGVTSRMGT